MGFEGKVAIITGGTSGIGLAVAKSLAEKGVRVAIAGRNEKKGEKALQELKGISLQNIFIPTDVTKTSDIQNLVSTTLDTFGKLDFAFNNAANDEITFAPTHEFAESDFDYMINVTLKGVWLCMKYEIQAMLEQGGGSIVNTSSLDALICPAGVAAYAAGKSGVIALSKSTAQEYGEHGIRINSFSPGAFLTPLLEKKFIHLSSEERLIVGEKYKNFNALGRIGAPEEAASVVTWLFSEQSSYITGQNIVADGGVCFV